MSNDSILRDNGNIKDFNKARAFGGCDGAAQGGPLKTGDIIMGAAGGAPCSSDAGGVGDVKRIGGPKGRGGSVPKNLAGTSRGFRGKSPTAGIALMGRSPKAGVR